MKGGSLERLQELLGEALEQPADQRGAFLDHACADDPLLRREVEELLALDDQAAGYFDGLSGDIASTASLELENAAHSEVRIGPYRTLAAIGRGGMGAVYLAERVDGAFDQQVALKLLHRDMDTPQLRTRFLAERQLLAGLSHPNIAHLSDGGVTDEGRPYFVMECVNGQAITKYCRENALGLNQMLRLFLQVIEAVSYLHRNLVVHRDLKPSNIFVDGDRQVKLLDFGIAKLLTDTPEDGGATRTGEQLMTPEYAAPEQLLGSAVTTATDVYALGIVLYELLTGSRPHDRSSSERRSTQSALPPTPSSLLRSKNTKHARPLSASARKDQAAQPDVDWTRIEGDLDTICLMALRPEPEARYPSAEQFGQDIQRYLDGLPVVARKSTVGYRFGKFVQRHRGGVLLAAVVVLLIVAGFVHERSLRTEAERSRVEAQLQAAKAVAVSGFLAELLSSVDPMKAQGNEVTVAEVLDQAAARLENSPELAEQPAVEAAVRRTIGNTFVSLGKYVEAREHLERAAELRGGLESSDAEALTTLADLGVLYLRLGLFEESEVYLQRVLDVRITTLGEEDPASLMAMGHLADLRWTEGKYDEVEALDRRTLEIRRRVLGADHADTLRSLNGLAATLFNNGRYGEAAPLFEEARAVSRKLHGDSHPFTLTLGNNLGAAYLELARYAEAEALFREIVEGRTRVLGRQHVETAMSIHNLGVTLIQQARFDEAETVLRDAVELRRTLPTDTTGAMFSASHLADVLREQGRFEEAVTLYLSILEEQREKHGPKHENTLKTMRGLAELRLGQGNIEAAEVLISAVLDSVVQVRGEQHSDTVESVTLMARLRNRQGRFAEALALSHRAISASDLCLGTDHPVALDAIYEQAVALAGQGKPTEARELAVRVFESRSHKLGAEHPDTLAARNFLGELS